MYDGDTMTQIFKRTKKCCAKLIRKLTFNTPTSANIPIKLRNSTRYVQQKDKICNKDHPPLRNSPENLSSTTTATGASWDIARNERLTSSNGFADEALSYEEEDYQMFQISPRFFLKRDMTTSYSRVDNRCKRNCNFSPRLGTSSLVTSMILTRKDLGKLNKSHNNNSSWCSDDEIVTNMKDGSGSGILFTSETTNNMPSDLPKVSSDNSSSPCRNNNPKKCDGTEKAINRCGTTTTATAHSQFIGFDIRNATWTGRKNETTTSFIVPQDLIEKFDSTLNLNSSFTASPSDEAWNESTITAGNKLAQHANECGSKLCNQIVFEKVKYDKNKKYLRHTPTNSSIGSVASSPNSLCNSRTMVLLDHSQSSFSLDNSISDNNLYSLVSRSPSNDNNLAWKRCNSASYDPNGNCYLPSVNSNPDEAINRINNLRRKYSGTWDSNGNSTDSRRILCEEAWDVFENKVNNARDKRMMILYPDGDDFIRASPRSSSTTLETWVDDEIFDNSFNEELERRCTSFER